MWGGGGGWGEKNLSKPFYGNEANSIAPDVTPQNVVSHLGLFCLLREISLKNFKITPEAPKNDRGLEQMVMMGKSNCHMSRVMRKADFCLCKNKGADQLCSNCTAEQRLCFR